MCWLLWDRQGVRVNTRTILLGLDSGTFIFRRRCKRHTPTYSVTNNLNSQLTATSPKLVYTTAVMETGHGPSRTVGEVSDYAMVMLMSSTVDLVFDNLRLCHFLHHHFLFLFLFLFLLILLQLRTYRCGSTAKSYVPAPATAPPSSP